MRKCFLLLTILFINNISSQELNGVILDGNNNRPLEGASVYFDNTTYGATTDSKGRFKFRFNPGLDTPLVISFIGYNTQILDRPEQDEELKILLFESNDHLEEVVLDINDDWSRSLKLTEFIKHYLGESENGLASTILNENDIVLRYNKQKKQLRASSKVPIFIKNHRLKYLISIELKHFEVNYSYVSKNKKRLNMSYVFYSSANFFKSLERKSTKPILKRRKEAYFGSTLHFMRALASENLNREGYKIYLGSGQVRPDKVIKVRHIDELNNVRVRLADRLSVLYKNNHHSSIESYVLEFGIDNFGNHSDLDRIRFGGNFGMQRMGDALPLDFLLTKYRRQKDI